MAKFYLYYSFGGCNDGSHSWGLEEFDALEAAKAEGERLKKNNVDDGSYVVVAGEKVADGDDAA